MNKIRNINRFWVDEDSRIIVRNWTNEEYKTTNPHTHIFERYWSYRCPICSFIPIPNYDKDEVKRAANSHMLYCGDNHKCKVEYRDHELVCLECRDEFLEDIGMWVAKQEIY